MNDKSFRVKAVQRVTNNVTVEIIPSEILRVIGEKAREKYGITRSFDFVEDGYIYRDKCHYHGSISYETEVALDEEVKYGELMKMMRELLN